jgi:hypothetical protein
VAMSAPIFCMELCKFPKMRCDVIRRRHSDTVRTVLTERQWIQSIDAAGRAKKHGE